MMKKSGSIIALLWLSYLLISCNSNSSDNPPLIGGDEILRVYTQEYVPPLPDFIDQISYYELKQDRLRICVYVSQREVWESGDYAETLNDKIRLNSELTIDGEISPLDFESCLIPGNLWVNHNDKGTLVGTYGDPTCVCTTIQLDKAEHEGSIQIKMPSQVEYSYSWKFEAK
ncbi:MAG: hypothetical protein BroJett018_48800 [Chloroflexota bacterium]|nr:hypothetical protein [Chloroflexota bacterium]NOG65772.1 hypothetical protein [Chloroflexota bacterium]GIK67086.1 MAG: hypothetical protein BroJett018_48800 [Chloroflexota bacterium]